jgi:murein L,D-transpeptidase YafK
MPSRNILRAISFLLMSLTLGCRSANHGESLPQPDHILIIKSARTLSLMKGDRILKTYNVALGRQPIGPKERQGDHRTPEGTYFVDRKLPNSRFHLALHLSYPNAFDRERAHGLGVSPGGDVEVHGLPSVFAWLGSLHRHIDWTDGCIAVTNAEIEEIYPIVSVGIPVEIRP